MEVTIDVLRQGDDEPRVTTAFDEPGRSEIAEPIVVENGIDVETAVPSRVVLEFGDAISGISRVSGQAARSIG
jgi:hypothetical protein